MVDPNRLDELEKSGEINRYQAATPVIGEFRKAGYSDEAIKNIMWHIAAESSWRSGAKERGNSEGGNGFIQLTGDANRRTYSDKLNKYIAENKLNYKPIDLVANRRQLDNDPQMQAVLARMYFDDRKSRGLNYEKFEDVHKALAPGNKNPNDRIELLIKKGWRKPEDADLMAWGPAVEPPKPVSPEKPVNQALIDSLRIKFNKDGSSNTTPQGK